MLGSRSPSSNSHQRIPCTVDWREGAIKHRRSSVTRGRWQNHQAKYATLRSLQIAVDVFEGYGLQFGRTQFPSQFRRDPVLSDTRNVDGCAAGGSVGQAIKSEAPRIATSATSTGSGVPTCERARHLWRGQRRSIAGLSPNSSNLIGQAVGRAFESQLHMNKSGQVSGASSGGSDRHRSGMLGGE